MTNMSKIRYSVQAFARHTWYRCTCTCRQADDIPPKIKQILFRIQGCSKCVNRSKSRARFLHDQNIFDFHVFEKKNEFAKRYGNTRIFVIFHCANPTMIALCIVKYLRKSDRYLWPFAPWIVYARLEIRSEKENPRKLEIRKDFMYEIKVTVNYIIHKF
jgi:hypothetical protein